MAKQKDGGPNKSKERPYCFLLRFDGWMFVATLPDVWHGRRSETSAFDEHQDYDDGLIEEL